MKPKKNKEETIIERYGIKHEQETIKEMIAFSVCAKRQSDVIDKFFPDLTNEQKGKVWLYHQAMNIEKKMYDEVR